MKVIKGYKVFNSNWTAKHDNFQYEVGKEYEMGGEITPCKRGFHFCENLMDCFKYYIFTPNLKIAEVEGTGQIKREGNKICCSHIRIVKEIAMAEVLGLTNNGVGNIGMQNLGNHNQGDDNQGNCNQGNCNQGNCNRGNCNQGNDNQGNCNRGNDNRGGGNLGSHNEGDDNQGDGNQGDFNKGNGNQGNDNTGDYNIGEYNTGIMNLGVLNQGNGNIGIGNRGDNIIGLFCEQEHPFYLFDKPCSMSLEEFRKTDNCALLVLLEHSDNPLRQWENLTDKGRQTVLTTENITPEILKRRYGIDVNKCEEP